MRRFGSWILPAATAAIMCVHVGARRTNGGRVDPTGARGQLTDCTTQIACWNRWSANQANETTVLATSAGTGAASQVVTNDNPVYDSCHVK